MIFHSVFRNLGIINIFRVLCRLLYVLRKGIYYNGADIFSFHLGGQTLLCIKITQLGVCILNLWTFKENSSKMNRV